MTEALVVLCTCPNSEVAHTLAQTVVNEQLAACVNVMPGVRSVYRWEGAICDDEEVLLIIKTTTDRLDALQQRVVELHPYDCPEVIALTVSGGSPDYLRWVTDQTRLGSDATEP